MISGTTRTGFEYEISDEALDDYDLLEALNEYKDGEVHLVTKIADYLLGREQKERLKDHARVNGRVSATKMMNEISDILNGSGEVKN